MELIGYLAQVSRSLVVKVIQGWSGWHASLCFKGFLILLFGRAQPLSIAYKQHVPQQARPCPAPQGGCI